MDDQLGPFQPMWEAWNEAHEELTRKPLSHFRRSLNIQFDELECHLAADQIDAATAEVADIICIGLNIMRWLGFGPEEIGRIVRLRAERRMKGRTLAILDKYRQLYDI